MDHEARHKKAHGSDICRLCEVALVDGKCPDCGLSIPLTQEETNGTARPVRTLDSKEVLVLGIEPSRELPRGIDVIPWNKLLTHPPGTSPNASPRVVEVDHESLHILDRKLIIIILPFGLNTKGTGLIQKLLVQMLFSFEARGEVVYIGDWSRPSELLPFKCNQIHLNRGRQIKSNPEWTFYFSRLGEWNQSFEGNIEIHTTPNTYTLIPGISEGAYRLKLLTEDLATNSLGHTLGLSIKIKLENSMRQWGENGIECGRCLLLPLSSGLVAEQAVPLLLTHHYGLTSVSPPPEWVDQMPRLSAEMAATEEILALKAEKLVLETKIASKEVEFLEHQEVLKLLYTTGAELEGVVCEALRMLGAQNLVEEPRGNQEDAIFSDPQGREYIVEVKGLKKSAKLDELRQLHMFREDRWSSGLDASPRKPLMIVNHECHKAPGTRRPDCVGSASDAQRLGHSCVSTVLLHRALLAHDRGILNLDCFWDSLYHASGIWDPTSIIPEI